MRFGVTLNMCLSASEDHGDIHSRGSKSLDVIQPFSVYQRAFASVLTDSGQRVHTRQDFRFQG